MPAAAQPAVQRAASTPRAGSGAPVAPGLAPVVQREVSTPRAGSGAPDAPGLAPAAARRPLPEGPLRRLELLCDRGSLQPLRSTALGFGTGARATPGDGVLAGLAHVDGRPVAVYAEDEAVLGGSLGRVHAATLHRVLELAERAEVPVVGFVASAGARLQDGLEALAGYGEIFSRITRLSGVVPQLSIISGVCAGGGAYAPALTDLVVMTRQAAMFLTGPGVVAQVTGEHLDAPELGGHQVHAANGVAHLIADDDAHAARLARDVLSHLPSRAGERAPRATPEPATGEDPGTSVPADPRRPYDVRRPAAALVDGGRLLELQADWAPNLVTALARIDGRPVGVVANQPCRLAGTLDAEAAQKGARFVRFCHAYGVALLTLVDTPGFLPGSAQETGAVIRHGAKLVHAYAEADVPKLTVSLRKSYGGAHIAMSSLSLGADLALAWPGAQLGVMGAEQAVGIVDRRAIAAAEDPAAERAARALAYADEHLGAHVAAAGGHVDDVVEPAHTRERLVQALRTMDGRSPVRAGRAADLRVGNVPL